ncbi:MAG TPA: cytochrome c [Rhizomicrobium sp.]|nr:cytochrome c [Rhizomicrobium sp.]
MSLAVGAGLACVPLAAGPNAKTGAQISAQCAACHGADGMSVDTTIPNLAGQHYVYLVQQLKAFKNHTRGSPLMNELAQPLTQQQIEDISAYYSQMPIEIGKRPKPKQ